MPLPPYIHRPDTAEDRERYQTVFARTKGSVAAPTAGLHFTAEMLTECRAAGAEIAHVTLARRARNISAAAHRSRRAGEAARRRCYRLSRGKRVKMRQARRLVAVGTTSVRTLETVARGGELRASSGETDIFIYPGFEFRATGAMLTNFHLPQSSLLLLVCAFAGRT